MGVQLNTKPALTAEQIRAARRDNPKMRERDLAAQLGISELELLAAHCGDGVTRIEGKVFDLLSALEPVGEVMALTRNESAVHEKIGVYDKIVGGDQNVLALGEQIDLRIFPGVWKHAFAVEKRDGDEVRHSLQFFDADGDAVHKVHLRPASNVEAYLALVARFVSSDQTPGVDVQTDKGATRRGADTPAGASGPSVQELRETWSKMTDVHQFYGLLQKLKLSRRQAVHMVGSDYAWPLECEAVAAMMHGAAEAAMPIMCFVDNRGCIQIHSGPIQKIAPMGPWLNVMDETFHLHLRTDHIREVWAVRKPTKDGHVTSVEAYDGAGHMIIQFFGKRHEGYAERPDWRTLVEDLPRAARQNAA